MNLKLSLLSIAAVAAIMIAGQSEAKAQNNGYQFGVGIGYSNGFNGCVRRPIRREIPYFAMHPPVYYSADIVRRPYGVSPFAAPPGIAPIEMTYTAPQPAVITNPYFRELRQDDVPPAPATDSGKNEASKKQPKKNDGKKKKDAKKGEGKEVKDQLNVVIANPFVAPKSDSLAQIVE